VFLQFEHTQKRFTAMNHPLIRLYDATSKAELLIKTPLRFTPLSAGCLPESLALNIKSQALL
jgi:hypothetical protein